MFDTHLFLLCLNFNPTRIKIQVMLTFGLYFIIFKIFFTSLTYSNFIKKTV